VSQDQVIGLLLRTFLISGFASIVLWVVLYSVWAPWWRNMVGRTIVVKDALIAALLVPTAVALFVHLSRRNSLDLAWADVALLALITPVMSWRIVSWARYRRRRRDDEKS
jgi:predicted ABC-type exoprotein transport system permease subunit